MAFNLLGSPKRRSRGGGGGGSKALDTLILVGGLGILGIGGYYFLKSGKSVEDALKSLVDAGNSTGDWIADGSYWIQDILGIGNTPGGRGEEESITDKLAKEVKDTKSDIERRKKNYVDRATAIEKFFSPAGEALGNIGCRFQAFYDPKVKCS